VQVLPAGIGQQYPEVKNYGKPPNKHYFETLQMGERIMGLRRTLIILVTILLASAVFVSVVNALSSNQEAPLVNLENVRDFAPATEIDGVNYAVDGGHLFVGEPGQWQRINTPNGVIVSAVATNRLNPELVYIGAANELAIYRSANAGRNWVRIPMETEAIGGVTKIGVDAANQLVYVGTDTAGLFRLRDVGSSMTAAGHLIIGEPVEEIAAESSGSAMVFVRTQWNLYRAEEMGLRWVQVDTLPSPATAVVIAEGARPVAFVGTASSGVRMSHDGVNWSSVNSGLNYGPGSQLNVTALAVDPAQPDVLYAGTRLSFGSTVLVSTPMGVSMSTDGARVWEKLAEVDHVAVTDLMPIPGRTGAIYALTEMSRTPVALGDAPVFESVAVIDTEIATGAGIDILSLLSWVLAGLAALGFLAIVWLDMTRRQRLAEKKAGTLVTEPVRNDR
jgi:photosystem II stability/assembly factor-like uncharacterized protein